MTVCRFYFFFHVNEKGYNPDRAFLGDLFTTKNFSYDSLKIQSRFGIFRNSKSIKLDNLKWINYRV